MSVMSNLPISSQKTYVRHMGSWMNDGARERAGSVKESTPDNNLGSALGCDSEFSGDTRIKLL